MIGSPTERRNPNTLAIDSLGTTQILELVNAEDAKVAGAVSASIPDLTKAVDAAVEAVHAGGRVHYFGAGTSGRLAVQDAAELPPTFHAPPDLVIAHHAGGNEALLRAVEDVEDNEQAGESDAAPVTNRRRSPSSRRTKPRANSRSSPAYTAPPMRTITARKAITDGSCVLRGW